MLSDKEIEDAINSWGDDDLNWQETSWPTTDEWFKGA